MSKSYKVEVQADSTRQWTSNMLRFGEEQEAEAYARDLWSRWSAVRAWRVVRSDDEPTDRWNGVRAVPVLRVVEGGRP